MTNVSLDLILIGPGFMRAIVFQFEGGLKIGDAEFHQALID
jgi:hypothetical protein